MAQEDAEGHTFWDATKVPPKESEDFKKIICGKRSKHFQPADAHAPAWISAPNAKTFSSFGDKGTTATVNAYGEILQASTYLGVGHSGIFTLDHDSVEEPYNVNLRAMDLDRWSSERISAHIHTYGLRIPITEETFVDAPEVKYVHYRWPRYEYKAKELEFTIQWMVQNGIVLQQCVVANQREEEVDVPFEFKAGKSFMKIRDLDYLDGYYRFNDSDEGYVGSDGPNNYSIVWAQGLIPTKEQSDSTNVQKPNENDTARDADVNSSHQKEAEDRVKTSIVDAKEDPEINSSPQNETKDDMETPSSDAQRDRDMNGSPQVTKTDIDTPNQDIGKEQIVKDDKGFVATIVSVFLNGNAMDWSDELSWTQKLTGKSSNAVSDNSDHLPQNVVEIITAYKLVVLPASKAHWRNFVIPYEQADVNSFMRSMPFRNIALTGHQSALGKNARAMGSTEASVPEDPDKKVENPSGSLTLASLPSDHIEFAVFQNLEYVLSVCSMPLVPPSLVQDEPQESPLESEKTTAIALTCGDISGHRICTSASFFAFQFLIKIAKRLKEMTPPDPYVSSLLDRISTVCKGHIVWLSEKAEKTESKCFAANYWATGKIMKGQSSSWRPNDSLTDTAFHLIKAAEYSAFYEHDKKFAQDAVRDVGGPWTESLQKWDRRERFAWPHRQEADTNLFRLDDHVWIWKGLKSIEDLGVCKLPRKYAPRDIQREMLRRFTTENDISRTRMLAVSRSSRDTRFLFHARDTALFYGHDWDFFLQETSFREVWDNTIKAQAYHDDNQETGWDNALRYALAVLMGTRNHSINKRGPADLVKSALAVLFRSTSPNGFFPGQLDITTKEPALFYAEQDRDFYFHASFEIPYILLVSAANINAIYEQGSDFFQSSKLHQNHQPSGLRDDLKTKVFSERQEKTNEVDGASLPPGNRIPTAQDGVGRQISDAARKSLLMKKINPFNSLIDSTSIVELEEEWLYNYPTFLQYEMSMSDEDIRKLLETLKVQEIDAAGHVILDGASRSLSKKDEPFDDTLSRKARRAYVVDTQSKRSLGKREKNWDSDLSYIFNNIVLWFALKKPRSAEESKKRFIWLPSADAETALVCYLCSHEVERTAISLFFDRHSNYEKFFFDDTTMFLNTWETELHLSFYQLLTPKGVLSEGIPKSSEDTLPGSQGRKISKASLGFRFVGDFFDRYWTCHFVQYIPAEVEDRYWNFDFHTARKDRAWRQRKVLELYLFERILTTLVRSTQELFDEIKFELGVRQGAFSFSILSSEDYFASSAQWQKFQHILQAVEDELETSISIIAKWETREKDRGQEKPRWTRNDERKYRGVIQKLLSSTNRKIRDLHRLHANIKSVKETLISSQDQIRDDLGLRGAENIRFFTYVTVVFLPLGFASSIFSMSGSPEGTTLARMASCAIVALVITVLALVNAKTLGVITEEINFFVDRHSRSTMSRSSIIRRHNEKRRQKQEEQNEKEANSRKQLNTGLDGARRRRRPSIESSWHFGFWFAYVFIELPARRVLLGYRALKAHRFTWTACLQISVGVFLLPFCIISYLTQVLAYNLMDLFMLFWGCVRGLFPTSTSDENEEFWNRMTMLTHPPDKSRPFNVLRSQMRKIRDRWREKRNAKQDKKVEEPTVEEERKEPA